VAAASESSARTCAEGDGVMAAPRADAADDSSDGADGSAVA
jgi:hypothetical protein